MRLSLKSSLLIAALTALCAAPAFAEVSQPDDRVTFNLSTEGWVTTKSARVLLGVEASVSGTQTGTMRADMQKAVNEVVKADWRLVTFNRGQDKTGMERWSAIYEARIAENELNGINEKAKKVSKAGMQISVANMDFSPTLEETQATLSALRSDIYKKAVEQLNTLNSSIAGRNYRIAEIDFMGSDVPHAQPAPANVMMMKQRNMMMSAAGAAEAAPEMDMAINAPMERSEKLVTMARVVLAAEPDAKDMHTIIAPKASAEPLKLKEPAKEEAKKEEPKEELKEKAELKIKEDLKTKEPAKEKLTNFNKETKDEDED